MLILPISAPTADLENAGGKGASLSRLARLGFPVPPGYIVTTGVYCQFVADNGLSDQIAASLRDVTPEDTAGLERASARIRLAFSAGVLSVEVSRLVTQAYLDLDHQPAGVAVRSSATTEDLPDLSFAGQQDTFLNVIGESQLLAAMVDCWSSLWTARAIGYRVRNAIPHDSAALAVIVQQMVVAEVSGVLFTANPLTGLLTESVIDAVYGLGEALVSGQVEPDHFVVDSLSGATLSLALGTKQTYTRGKSGGGVESVRAGSPGQQTLSDGQVRRLVAAGQKIQEAYGAPQDIEWAFSSGELFILQSRPVTSLFPLPRVSCDPLILWMSFGAFQGMLGPMTPLGRESIQRVVLGIGEKVGAQIKFEEQDILAESGERIWVRINDLVRNPLGNRLLGLFLGIGEPGTALILRQLASDSRLGAGKGRLKFRTLRRMVGFVAPALLELPRAVLQPEKQRARFDARLEAYLWTVRIPPGSDRFEWLANFAAFMAGQGGLAGALPIVLPLFMPLMAPSLVALNLIGRLLPREVSGGQGPGFTPMDVTRGLPRNVTTEMDLALWETAKAIRDDDSSAHAFVVNAAPSLAALYLSGGLPGAAQVAVSRFLDQYGTRGIGEIDLGQPRWREDPTPVFRTLQSYQTIPPGSAPDLVFERNARAAGEAIERMASAVRSTRLGRIKEKLLRGAACRVRVLLGARESPKFLAVRAMGIVRAALLEIGQEFAAAGAIDRADDLFFLHVSELAALSRREPRDWKALIVERRLTYQRESRRRQVPRLLVSDGRAFYEGVGVASDTSQVINGSPVSPGVVEGIVHVVYDPRLVQLVPGEILVCPGTDPAWTPLFMAAAGLIMEVGGMMTHGSVVAREYGIPAVVGVHQATARLKDGQRVRLDGSTGRIYIL